MIEQRANETNDRKHKRNKVPSVAKKTTTENDDGGDDDVDHDDHDKNDDDDDSYIPTTKRTVRKRSETLHE